jgi:hypothetical protein
MSVSPTLHLIDVLFGFRSFRTVLITYNIFSIALRVYMFSTSYIIYLLSLRYKPGTRKKNRSPNFDLSPEATSFRYFILQDYSKLKARCTIIIITRGLGF